MPMTWLYLQMVEKKSLKSIMDCLKKYEAWSGQAIKKSNLAIYFSDRITRPRKRAILRATGFVQGSFPFKYLGFPIVTCRLLNRHLEDLLEKIKRKIEGWKARLLSKGARLILLRHVLSSVPVHLLSIIPIPKSTIESLNRTFSSFFGVWKIGNQKRNGWLGKKFANLLRRGELV